MNQWSAREVFLLAVKVMGVYFIVKGLGYGVISVSSLFSQDMSADYTFWIAFISVAYPLIILLMGIYLLAGMPGMSNRLYHNLPNGPVLESLETVFSLALRIMGAAAIIIALPELAQVIMNLLYIYHFQAMAINTITQQWAAVSKVTSNILYLVLGFYLLTGGRVFLRIAFPQSGEYDLKGR